METPHSYISSPSTLVKLLPSPENAPFLIRFFYSFFVSDLPRIMSAEKMVDTL